MARLFKRCTRCFIVWTRYHYLTNAPQRSTTSACVSVLLAKSVRAEQAPSTEWHRSSSTSLHPTRLVASLHDGWKIHRFLSNMEWIRNGWVYRQDKDLFKGFRWRTVSCGSVLDASSPVITSTDWISWFAACRNVLTRRFRCSTLSQ